MHIIFKFNKAKVWAFKSQASIFVRVCAHFPEIMGSVRQAIDTLGRGVCTLCERDWKMIY